MAKVSLRAYNREIETMIDRGQLDEAIANCHHIFKTHPKHLETYRLLGKAYLEYKRFKEAVDVFSRVLVSEPNDFVANVGMSIIRDDENKLDDAIWHMERAFETQPSNAAIQSELQRLYGRRDGVQPPRIRMTRGALAHMYVQGELYPQAISEIKSVLKEDPGRSDMEALLARACYRSGLKNEAADAASKVLRRYPYCLDANRVLMEILGADHPENAQIYRQRVVELDPYAAQVTGSVFQSNEVQDAAVSLEHLDWNGQPSASQADWGASQAISLESGEQPDWLKNNYADTNPLTSTSPTRPLDQTQGEGPPVSGTAPGSETAEEIPEFLRAAGWGQSTGEFDESKSIFGDEQSSAMAAQPIEQGEMPDWVKAMAPTEATQPPAEEEVLPDWINKIGTGSLAIPSASQPDNDQDWMSQLGQSSEPAASTQTEDSDLDWLTQIGQPAQSTESAEPAASAQILDDPLAWTQQINEPTTSEAIPAADDLPDWLTPPSLPVSPASMEQTFEEHLPPSASLEPATDDTLDWMKQLDQPSAADSTDLPDWMMQPGQSTESAPATTEPDWMKPLDQPTASTADLPAWMTEPAQPAATEQSIDDQPDWMKPLDQPAASTADLPDWMTQPEQPAGSTQPGATAQSTDEQPDWMRPLGLPEDLPVSMERPSDEQMVITPISSDIDFPDELTEELQQEIPASTEIPTVPASMQVQDTDNLGVSEQDRDDSFAWLENLAAKQGASEGLLTKPEDRLQEEPDWVKQAKGLSMDQPSVEQAISAEGEQETQSHAEPTSVPFEASIMQDLPPLEAPPLAQQPTGSIEELGKSDQERDDSFSWLENLAAKQGASEGLLTKPEDRLEQEPEWVRQAKELNVAASDLPESSLQTPTESPAPEEPIAEVFPPVFEESEQPAASPLAINREELGKSEQERDDSFAWLENLAAKQGASEGLLTKPEDRLEQEPDWVRQAKDLNVPSASVQTPIEPPAMTPVEPIEEVVPPVFEESEQPSIAPVAVNREELGKSDQERDDSFAWLENLAAKQGATEGLLTNPEDRLEQEPEWVTQAKDFGESAPAMPSMQPPESLAQEVSAQEHPALDDTAAWLRSLDKEDAKTEPVAETSSDDTSMWMQNLGDEESEPDTVAEPSKDDTAMWFKNLAEEESKPAPVVESSKDDTAIWFKNLSEAEAKPIASTESANDETAMWLKSLDEAENPAPQPETSEHPDLPAWMQNIGEETFPAAEATVPEKEARDTSVWPGSLDESAPPSPSPDAPKRETGSLPSWLRGLEKTESQTPESRSASAQSTSSQDDLPAWLRDETGELVAEPTRIEPTRATDWQPAQAEETLQPAPPAPEPASVVDWQPVEEKRPEPSEPVAQELVKMVEEKPGLVEKPAPEPELTPAAPPPPYKEPVTRRGTGMLTMPLDPILGSARNELSRSNIPAALDTYAKLIKKGRFLDEVVHDLREALYRYPVEVNIWQSLGDAYMRSNRLQDALDAYTKAEELLR